MSTHKKPRCPRWPAERNRFAIAASKQRADREFASQILTVRVILYSIGHGEDATELLARLAVVIGTPCEAGARQFGKVPWVSQLHGALRTIQALCLRGYTWDAQYAHPLNAAIDVATQPRPELTPANFVSAWTEASALFETIMRHKVDAESIAGAIQ
jgi:hypothetical protein